MPHLYEVKPIGENTELKYTFSHLARVSSDICLFEEKLKESGQLPEESSSEEEEEAVEQQWPAADDDDHCSGEGRDGELKLPDIHAAKTKKKKKKKKRFNISRLIQAKEEVRRLHLDDSADMRGSGSNGGGAGSGLAGRKIQSNQRR